jgi:hypothetical protein
MTLRTDEIETDCFGHHPRGHLSHLLSESGRKKGRELRISRLLEITIDAVAMDFAMRTQRAELFLHYSTAFDSKLMQIEPVNSERGEYVMENQEVGLVVRPALIMLGNWDGEGFHGPHETLIQSGFIPLGALARSRHAQRMDHTSDSGESQTRKRANSRTRIW